MKLWLPGGSIEQGIVREFGMAMYHTDIFKMDNQ